MVLILLRNGLAHAFVEHSDDVVELGMLEPAYPKKLASF